MENEIIDWENAKKYSLQVMEYFGSRLVWNQMQDIIDPNTDVHLTDQQVGDDDSEPIASTSSHSSVANKPPPPPNDIEYEDDDN